ncbi:hypothetical protein SAMN04488505_10561 [Chitinophaga rupis]|uniref:PXPV repeat-containing protein n=1 Tax=Chitinophaga rupis TaxID=573321 RepID=A0A1H7ZE06_9BACT|nr:hypothetical protein [Chitinophaga rupis]SEM56762.1 hypothetical protein SAMN04488505_10561 [Chitinophaga rupis]
MKRVLFMMLLLGGIVLSAQAQRGGWGYGPPGHYKHWKRDRCDDRRYYGGYYNECRDRRVVVYERPVVYGPPVYVAPPPPPPVVYYPARPRAHVVINAGVTFVR